MENDPLFSPMQKTVTRNLLKYAAGRAIFCPLCGAIMDQSRTVIITAGQVTKVLCAPCWDNELRPKISAERLAQCDIVDGREYFPTKRKQS